MFQFCFKESHAYLSYLSFVLQPLVTFLYVLSLTRQPGGWWPWRASFLCCWVFLDLTWISSAADPASPESRAVLQCHLLLTWGRYGGHDPSLRDKTRWYMTEDATHHWGIKAWYQYTTKHDTSLRNKTIWYQYTLCTTELDTSLGIAPWYKYSTVSDTSLGKKPWYHYTTVPPPVSLRALWRTPPITEE